MAHMCRGKKRFRDEIAAKLALAVIQRKDKEGHNECRTYHCPICKRYHLTSKPEKEYSNASV